MLILLNFTLCAALLLLLVLFVCNLLPLTFKYNLFLKVICSNASRNTCACCGVPLTEVSRSQWEYFTMNKKQQHVQVSVCKTCNALISEYAETQTIHPEDIINHLKLHPQDKLKIQLNLYSKGLWHNNAKLLHIDEA